MNIIKSILLVLLLFSLSPTNAQTAVSIKIHQLDSLIKSSKKPLVVNFWATFCEPCIKELPYFESILLNEYKGKVDFVLVSLDLPSYYPEKVDNFIAKRKIRATTYWLNETDANLFCPVIDKNWSGSIPATLFVNNASGYKSFIEAQISKEDLRKKVEKLIK